MSTYKKILVASDLAEDTKILLDRAATLSGKDTEVHIAHVVEPVTPYGGEWMFDVSDLQNRLYSKATTRLMELASYGKIKDDDVHLLTGRAESAIPLCANEIGADLLLAGWHPRSGLAVLLGSTSREMLKELPCDAFLVRLKAS